MSEKSSEVRMPSPNTMFRQMLDYHETITDPNYDDMVGLQKAYQEARLSPHTTQVGAYLCGMSAHNQPIGQFNEHAHAESWVIATCARVGIRTQGQTLYAPWAACVDCAIDIVGAGISRVVTHSTVMDLTPGRWQHSVQRGLEILYDQGVRVDIVEAELHMTIMFDGKEVKV